MQEVSRKVVDKEQTTKKVVRKLKDDQGKVLQTVDDYIPATVYTYEVLEKCKYCGHMTTHIEKETKSAKS